MIKIALLVVAVVGAGAAGFFAESFMRPAPPPEKDHMEAAAPVEDTSLYKLPIGKFTAKVRMPDSVRQLAFALDLYLQGAKRFDEMNGTDGRIVLRDAVLTALADITETDLRLHQDFDPEEMAPLLAAEIVRKIYLEFPAVRTARVSEFYTTVTPLSSLP